MNHYWYMDLSLCIIESFLILYFLNRVLSSRGGNNILHIISFSLYGVVSYFIKNLDLISKMSFTILCGGLIIYILYKDNIGVKLGCLIHSFYILTISDILVVGFIALLNESSIFLTLSYLNYISFIVIVLVKLCNIALFFISAHIFSKISKKRYFWFCFDIISLCFLLISITLANLQSITEYKPNDLKVLFFLSFLLLISSFIIVYLFSCISSYISKENYWKLISVKSDYVVSQINLLNEKIYETNKIKHDIKKVLNTISYLSYHNQNHELEKYLKEINSDFIPKNIVSYSNNFYIDSVLNLKVQECTSLNIDLKLSISPFLNISICNNDTVLILSNLLDNAIKAVNKLSDNKSIFIKIYNYGENVILYSSNYFLRNSDSDNIDFTTSKNTQEDGHGIGLQIVKEIVNKYDGNISIYTENDLFKVLILLPNHQ